MIEVCKVRTTYCLVSCFPVLLLLAVLFPGWRTLAADEPCDEAARLIKKGTELADGSVEEKESYEEAIALCPSIAEAYYNLGLLELKQGFKQEAEQHFKKSIEIDRWETIETFYQTLR